MCIASHIQQLSRLQVASQSLSQFGDWLRSLRVSNEWNTRLELPFNLSLTAHVRHWSDVLHNDLGSFRLTSPTLTYKPDHHTQGHSVRQHDTRNQTNKSIARFDCRQLSLVGYTLFVYRSGQHLIVPSKKYVSSSVPEIQHHQHFSLQTCTLHSSSFDAHCCRMGTAIKHPLPSFICNFWHLGTLTLRAERQRVRGPGCIPGMAQNALYLYLGLVGVKGLKQIGNHNHDAKEAWRQTCLAVSTQYAINGNTYSVHNV